MLGAVGIVMIFVMVFGGFIFAGGKMGIILEALRSEEHTSELQSL